MGASGLVILIMGAPLYGIIIYLIIGFIYNVLFKRDKKGRSIFKTIDTKNADQKTIITLLNNCSNYHKVIKLNPEMFLFINNYYISLVLNRNYNGVLMKTDDPEVLMLQKGDRQEYIENPGIRIKKAIDLILKVVPDITINGYMIVGATCTVSYTPEVYRIIQTQDTIYYINRQETVKKFSNDEIDEIENKVHGM